MRSSWSSPSFGRWVVAVASVLLMHVALLMRLKKSGELVFTFLAA